MSVLEQNLPGEFTSAARAIGVLQTRYARVEAAAACVCLHSVSWEKNMTARGGADTQALATE